MHSPQHFVVSGITGGMGLALATKLLAEGHRVSGCGRREDPIGDAEGYSFTRLDVTDFEAVSDWAAAVREAGVPIDFLVHNAAVIHENANLWEIDRSQLEAVIDVNIKGSFNVLEAFLPQMLERQRGTIVVLSSGAGRMGIPSIAGYCASKWAVEGLTKSLAQELPEGMIAVPMSPGMVDTDMLRTNFGAGASAYPKPDTWAEIAVPYILALGPEHNGESLTVPVN